MHIPSNKDPVFDPFIEGGFFTFTPFSELPVEERKRLYTKLEQDIASIAKRYGGLFTSSSVLDEPNRPHIYDQHKQCYFLGLDGHTIWNMNVSTANDVYWNGISSLAWDYIHKNFPKQKTESTKDWLDPVYEEDGSIKRYTMKPREKKEEFGGLTDFEYHEKIERQLIADDTGNTYQVYECFRIDSGYEYGIGLTVILDAPYITLKDLDQVITRFRGMGEAAWWSDTPVPHDHLPTMTYTDLLKEKIPK